MSPLTERDAFHYHAKTPFILRNRSLMVRLYRNEGPKKDEFTFCISTRNCEDLDKKYADLIGKDVKADTEYYCNHAPHPNGGTMCNYFIRSHPKGAIPDWLVKMFSGKIAGIF